MGGTNEMMPDSGSRQLKFSTSKSELKRETICITVAAGSTPVTSRLLSTVQVCAPITSCPQQMPTAIVLWLVFVTSALLYTVTTVSASTPAVAPIHLAKHRGVRSHGRSAVGALDALEGCEGYAGEGPVQQHKDEPQRIPNIIAANTNTERELPDNEYEAQNCCSQCLHRRRLPHRDLPGGTWSTTTVNLIATTAAFVCK